MGAAQVHAPIEYQESVQQQHAHQQGDIYREDLEWALAITCYQESIQLNPEFSWSHHSLGDCFRNLGLWEDAISAYQKAIALNPSFVWSHYSLAEVFVSADQLPMAAQSYQQVLLLDSKNEQVPPRLASVLQQLIQRSPRNVDYYQSLAEQYLAEGKVAEAIATFHMALQIQPNNPKVAIALSELIADQDPPLARDLIARTSSTVLTQQDVHTPELLADPQTIILLLKHTHLFDAIYYRACHEELSHLSDASLLAHYVEHVAEYSAGLGNSAHYNPNPLFDNQFYLERYPEVAQGGLNPLAHYHCFGYCNGYDPHPCFSTTTYQSLNPDVAAAEIDPLAHYLACGAQAGRVAFSIRQFPHILETQTPVSADYLQPLRPLDSAAASQVVPQSIGVYCNTHGNYFITEIADFIAAALDSAGHCVTRLSEWDEPPADLDSHWVIAPHEFFYLGEGLQWTQRVEWLKQAVMVNVEQPQTTWFSKAFHFLRHTQCIFDINVKSAAIMQALGLPAYWLPLGILEDYSPFSATQQLPNLPAVRSLPTIVRASLPPLSAPLSERPLDIQFIGTLNPRREAFFVRSASWLSEYRCFLHMPPMGMPLLKGQDQALDTEAVIGISRRSKILLNVHRDPLPYFEWHRMVFHGLWQNTLVVTELCHDIPGLVAGEHFVACSLSEMADRIAWLLRSAEGVETAERIRSAGHEALKARFNGASIAAQAASLADKMLSKRR